MKVIKRVSELITPSKQTPKGLKYLSDIDDQLGLRCQIPGLQIYNNKSDKWIDDPAKVLREAIAEALVYYYPFAGRLREVGNDGKLAVDCTGEGVVFTEADADFGVEEFGDVVQIPIHGWPGTSWCSMSLGHFFDVTGSFELELS
ncbi:unnamed protein product [Rhodiola kirilowii]